MIIYKCFNDLILFKTVHRYKHDYFILMQGFTPSVIHIHGDNMIWKFISYSLPQGRLSNAADTCDQDFHEASALPVGSYWGNNRIKSGVKSYACSFCY